MSHLSSSRARGFSLIELLLVLAIVAALAVAAFILYPKVNAQRQASASVSDLNAMKAAVSSMYLSSTGRYPGLTTAIANQGRVIPSSLNGGDFTATAPIRTPWGGALSINVLAADRVTIFGPDLVAGRAYAVAYTLVPDDVCGNFIAGAASNFQDITVGTTTIFDANGFNPALTAPLCVGQPTITFYSM
jgi:prepilin-type N-terminal cleavage/methylation domain-containing protein